MCGIAGLISPRLAAAEREAVVTRMTARLTHRGPDQSGQISRGIATLGARRLAIFDPAHGRQPMTSADGRWTVAFNGAIYNHAALREELQRAGTRFRTRCDTEVLVEAWAAWGEGCLDRLRGMYAFALWDDAQSTLHLVRDPFGIKPLYWREHDGGLAFASELDALAAGGRQPLQVDPVAVDAYLAWLAVPAPQTIYRGVFSVRPGERLAWRHGHLATHPTWRFPRATPALACPDRAAFQRELRRRLEETVAAHRLADVPVGAFLSGGLDSAVVVGLMAQQTRGRRLKTFTLGFPEADFSEAQAAAATAAHFGTDHHEVEVSGHVAAAEVDRFVAALDQPTGDGFNTFLAAQAARRGGVTVALSGAGGDELFGGYPSFQLAPRLARAAGWWQRLPPRWRRAAAAGLRQGGTRRRKLADTLEQAHDLHAAALLQRRVLSDADRQALLQQAGPSTLLHPELSRLPAQLKGAGSADVISAWELRTYLADVLLRDGDVMSMVHSLELRVPFVDRLLIEWLWQQPAKFRFTPAAPKSALALATADLLPPGLAQRPKRGFTLPLPRWMRSELRPFLEDTFAPASVARAGLLDPQAVQAQWRQYLSGNDDRAWSRIWSTAILIAFLNRGAAA